ncbi:MAG: uracil-DNA glycosylase family protein [Anaerolineae bacterium]|nr:uracil-DNA glycosylase family protein [Anaerolineae bacterium]MBL6966168.1 uracil-DNA glycosylase family protein [Anaerolineales bacterium]
MTTQTLPELHKQMRACRLCLDDGHEITPPAVFSGVMGARIMTIGQAPGITEVEVGRPFNAGSGQRLFKWLADAGIEEDWFRATQYMTSVTKCYPGRAKGGSGDRVPGNIEQEFCRPFLDREIELVNPALMIPIGRLAINLFFPKSKKLTEIIGTQKQVQGRWVVPLPHSSGASRWHQIESNRLLIEKAVALIAEHRQQIFAKK